MTWLMGFTVDVKWDGEGYANLLGTWERRSGRTVLM